MRSLPLHTFTPITTTPHKYTRIASPASPFAALSKARRRRSDDALYGGTEPTAGRNAPKLAARHAATAGNTSALKATAASPVATLSASVVPVPVMAAAANDGGAQPKRTVTTQATSVEAEVVLSSKDPVQDYVQVR